MSDTYRPPEPLPRPSRPPPQGTALGRAWRAVVREGRMPGALRRPWDRLMVRLGRAERTERVGPFRVTYRRGTADETFVRRVLREEEYFRLAGGPPGWALPNTESRTWAAN